MDKFDKMAEAFIDAIRSERYSPTATKDLATNLRRIEEDDREQAVLRERMATRGGGGVAQPQPATEPDVERDVYVQMPRKTREVTLEVKPATEPVLLPCPFCGKSACVSDGIEDDNWHMLGCSDTKCPASGMMSAHRDQELERIIAIWNTRAEPGRCGGCKWWTRIPHYDDWGKCLNLHDATHPDFGCIKWEAKP